MQLDRSANVRSIIKQFYIFVVLALIVLVFSVMKLDQGGMFDVVTLTGQHHQLLRAQY
jgi:hypothetical protein